ncbi:uncharacterized protein LOC135685488 [Rhopilema esculentum]|uniref:uncharacterized protein LOC135685488 n=1 Tax=Rhopilema esculentum TaxID=499914 RepID=UPI0031D7F3B5
MASEKQEILQDVLGIAIDISNLVLNFSLAYALKKLNKLRIVSYLFIFWLSVSDFLVGATGLLYHIGCLLQINSKIVFLLHGPVVLFLHCSGLLTITIAIDRCIHMKLLNRYGCFMTIRKSHVILVLNPINAAASLVFRHFFKKIYFSIFLIFFLFLCIIYILTYFSIKENIKNIRVHSGPKNTVADFSSQNEHRCADLVNDQKNQINIGNITCTNNVNQVNTTGIREACFGGQEEKQHRTVERREMSPNNCHRFVVKKSGAGEDYHLSKNRDAQKVASSRKRGKRPENEFGKAMIFILTVYAVSFVPVNIILLINILSPNLVAFSYIKYIRLLPNCNSSFNAVIFIYFSSELKCYFQTLLFQRR